MAKQGDGHDYLLSKLRFVNERLAQETIADDDFQEVVVSFCISVEKIFKIKLYKKNPLLIFTTRDGKTLSNKDNLVQIVKKSDGDFQTSGIGDVLYMYERIFPRSLKQAEVEAIQSLVEYRNQLVHSHKKDKDLLFDKTDLTKKMSAVWEKRIQPLAIQFFGKSKIRVAKVTNKYSELELKQLHESLVDEVREKIANKDRRLTQWQFADNSAVKWSNMSMTLGGSKCPRCGNFNFGRKDDIRRFGSLIPSGSNSLYKCEDCGLELNEREYRIAKQIHPLY